MGDSYKEWKNLFPLILAGSNHVESLYEAAPQKGRVGINSWTIEVRWQDVRQHRWCILMLDNRNWNDLFQARLLTDLK